MQRTPMPSAAGRARLTTWLATRPGARSSVTTAVPMSKLTRMWDRRLRRSRRCYTGRWRRAAARPAPVTGTVPEPASVVSVPSVRFLRQRRYRRFRQPTRPASRPMLRAATPRSHRRETRRRSGPPVLPLGGSVVAVAGVVRGGVLEAPGPLPGGYGGKVGGGGGGGAARAGSQAMIVVTTASRRTKGSREMLPVAISRPVSQPRMRSHRRSHPNGISAAPASRSGPWPRAPGRRALPTPPRRAPGAATVRVG